LPVPGGGAMMGTMTETPLTHVDENWQRALVVVAHPDDMEFGAAAAVARWTGQGKDVVYCLVTSGEAGIDGLEPQQCGPLREAEQRESCRVVGVEQVEFLHLPDGVLEYGVALRRRIAEVVRRHRPDVVITNNFRDTWDGATNLNQADHIATGRATLDAVRDAGNRWVFPEQVEAGLQPWPDVLAVWAAASPDSRHAADVTETFDAGVESLRAHGAYLEGLGWTDFDPDAFLRGNAAAVGERLGVPLASSFEVLPLQWGGTED
jgi:LmbE family N-acetylglucosaminyl deacetylase